MNLKRIYNQTAVTQSISWKGVLLSIKPYEEQLVDPDIADAFLDRCMDFVVTAPDEFATVATMEPEKKTVWIANMTGNPDAPAKIELREWKEKQWQWIQCENPVKNPINLREYALGPMVEYTSKDGVLEALNTPGKYITVPAFQRVEFDSGTAQWFLERSNMSSPVSRSGTFPKCVVSRKPSNFEPDMSWDLNVMLAYLKFVDPDCKLPRDEQTVTKYMKKKTAEEVRQALNEEKRLVMKKLYFRLVDPQYRLPTRREFEEFLKGPGAFVEEPPEAEDDKLLEQALAPDPAPTSAA
jgi:hypothetical protein